MYPNPDWNGISVKVGTLARAQGSGAAAAQARATERRREAAAALAAFQFSVQFVQSSCSRKRPLVALKAVLEATDASPKTFKKPEWPLGGMDFSLWGCRDLLRSTKRTLLQFSQCTQCSSTAVLNKIGSLKCSWLKRALLVFQWLKVSKSGFPWNFLLPKKGSFLLRFQSCRYAWLKNDFFFKQERK